MRKTLLKTDDPAKKWPSLELFKALGFPGRMISAISFYHPEFPAEISFRELFEIVISDSNHRREGYLISPMLDYRAIGMAIFHQVLSILNSTNFRPNIKRIWDLKYEKLKKSYRVIGFERYGWSKALDIRLK